MHKFAKYSTLAVSLISAGLLFASSALAVDLPAQTPGQVGNGASMRLQDTKLKSCQAKENGVNQRSTHLVRLVTTMESKFDAIEKRVEDYYNSKVVPSGKTVPNYSSLISDVQTKKAAVQTALTKAQADSTSFSCTSDDPKGQLTQFRVDMQAVKSALKDYRTSIRNLIVAVHSVTGSGSQSPEGTGGTK